MELEFSKNEMIKFLSNLNYSFKELVLEWKKEIICYPAEIPWENFTALKKENELVIFTLEKTFKRELKNKLLKL